MVPFVQFKNREKHPWRNVNFSKVTGLQPATLLKLTLLHGWFSRFLNSANGTKSRNVPQLSALSVRLYIDSMMLVIVTLGKLQSTRKTSQHLTLKSNCKIFLSHIFGKFLKFGDAGKGWERMPVAWRRGISEMSGDVWNTGGVWMDVKKCL